MSSSLVLRASDVQRIPAIVRFVSELRAFRASLPDPIALARLLTPPELLRYAGEIGFLNNRISFVIQTQATMLLAMRRSVETAYVRGSITYSDLLRLRGGGLASLGLGPVMVVSIGIAAAIVAAGIAYGLGSAIAAYRIAVARANATTVIAAEIAARVRAGQSVPELPDLGGVTGNPDGGGWGRLLPSGAITVGLVAVGLYFITSKGRLNYGKT